MATKAGEHKVHPIRTRFECEFCGDVVQQYPAESKQFKGKKICCECAVQEAISIMVSGVGV